jgi:hypothetical protein
MNDRESLRGIEHPYLWRNTDRASQVRPEVKCESYIDASSVDTPEDADQIFVTCGHCGNKKHRREFSKEHLKVALVLKRLPICNDCYEQSMLLECCICKTSKIKCHFSRAQRQKKNKMCNECIRNGDNLGAVFSNVDPPGGIVKILQTPTMYETVVALLDRKDPPLHPPVGFERLKDKAAEIAKSTEELRILRIERLENETLLQLSEVQKTLEELKRTEQRDSSAKSSIYVVTDEELEDFIVEMITDTQRQCWDNTSIIREVHKRYCGGTVTEQRINRLLHASRRLRHEHANGYNYWFVK